MFVILMCPRCKKRFTVDYNVWIESCLPTHDHLKCDSILCDKNPLVYHKDAVEGD